MRERSVYRSVPSETKVFGLISRALIPTVGDHVPGVGLLPRIFDSFTEPVPFKDLLHSLGKCLFAALD